MRRTVVVGICLLIGSAVTSAGELPGKVTGGGSIPPSCGGQECCDGSMTSGLCAVMVMESASSNASVGGKATFGFTVQCCPTKGNLVYHDHALGVDIKSISISSSQINCPCATFQGKAKVNGQVESFTVRTFDGGEPGSSPDVGPDTFEIQTDSYSAFGELIGGNIQCQQMTMW